MNPNTSSGPQQAKPTPIAGDPKPAPLPEVKKTPAKRDAVYYRAKLQNVQSVLKKLAEEISVREKKGESMGILLRQRRSLRSWEARFQKILKVG